MDRIPLYVRSSQLRTMTVVVARLRQRRKASATGAPHGPAAHMKGMRRGGSSCWGFAKHLSRKFQREILHFARRLGSFRMTTFGSFVSRITALGRGRLLEMT